MLRLRPEQFEALKAHSLRAMESRLAAAIGNTWPKLCLQMGPQALRSRIAAARVQAVASGLQREMDILRYVRLTLAWDEDLGETARTKWAQEILAWKGTDAATRLDALEGRSDAELAHRPELLARLA